MTYSNKFTESDRKVWMGALAKAPVARLAEFWAGYGDQPGFDWHRQLEIGGVMVRGRMGPTGIRL